MEVKLDETRQRCGGGGDWSIFFGQEGLTWDVRWGGNVYCTAKTVYQKFETNIPRNETARPQSQFLYSCFFERLYIPTFGLRIVLQ
jgi:hypothetical protein